jgi:protein TonB
MTSQQILQSDVLDILFEGRNKAYGAYLLRRTYHTQLLKAIGITASLVIALLFFGGPSATKEYLTHPRGGIILTDVAVMHEKKIELPKPKTPPPSAPKVKTEVFLDRIKINDKLLTPIATQANLDIAAPGAAKFDGPPATGFQPPPLPPSAGTGTIDKAPEKVDPPLANRQPQYPGGADAWAKFLNRYLMPPADLEAGEKRSVLVRFSVDEEGVITNFQVVRSGGADLDNEVIRVLKKMPHWLPAIQNGRPVAVSFTQPVTFTAAD